MSISNASATWNGDLKTGKGEMKPANGPSAPFSFKTRFEGEKGTNPEEMVGAAFAGCCSMALSVGLAQAGATDVKIDTQAKVTLEKVEGGFGITGIALTTRVGLKGIDAAKLKTIAEETKKNCPVSKALAATKITLDASLA